jgi:hypothetical protein
MTDGLHAHHEHGKDSSAGQTIAPCRDSRLPASRQLQPEYAEHAQCEEQHQPTERGQHPRYLRYAHQWDADERGNGAGDRVGNCKPLHVREPFSVELRTSGGQSAKLGRIQSRDLKKTGARSVYARAKADASFRRVTLTDNLGPDELVRGDHACPQL